MTPHEIKETVKGAANIILACIIMVADGDKKVAITGAKAIHRDMLADIERLWGDAKVQDDNHKTD